MEKLGQIINDLQKRQEVYSLNLQNLPTSDYTNYLLSEITNISEKIAQTDVTISTSLKAKDLLSEIIQMIRERFLTRPNQPSSSRGTGPPADKSEEQSIQFFRKKADIKVCSELNLKSGTLLNGVIEDNLVQDLSDDCPSESSYGFDEIRRRNARQFIAGKVKWWMSHNDFKIAENPYASIRLSLDLPTSRSITPNLTAEADNQKSSITLSNKSSFKRTKSPSKQSKKLKIQIKKEKFRVAMSHVSRRVKRRESVERLGGTVVESADGATVLIAETFLRTIKILVAVAKGVPIVGPDWLEASEKMDCFLDPWDYLLQDPEGEERFAFHLKATLQKSAARQNKPLLAGWSIFVTKNVRPPPDDMKAIVNSCGGNYIDRLPKDRWPENTRIISCEEDVADVKKIKNRPTVVKAEWIMGAILGQRLEHDDKYELLI